jgi:hypothetical protein
MPGGFGTKGKTPAFIQTRKGEVMKVKGGKSAEAFKPVEVTLTFENLNELSAFYAIFNFKVITDIVGPYLDHGAIREEITNANGGFPSLSGTFHSALTSRLK